MKLKDLLDRIATIYEQVEEQENVIKILHTDIRNIRQELENIPSEINEVEIEGKEEDEQG